MDLFLSSRQCKSPMLDSLNLVIQYRMYCDVKLALKMFNYIRKITVKILKFGTPQTIAIIVLKLVKFDVTLH